jgi:DNA-binding NarL/FixJ family response regulator
VWIDLESVLDGRFVHDAVLRGLGATEVACDPWNVGADLARVLAGREVLLILSGVGHVTAATARLAAAALESEGVSLLVVGRMPLRLPQEVVVRADLETRGGRSDGSLDGPDGLDGVGGPTGADGVASVERSIAGLSAGGREALLSLSVIPGPFDEHVASVLCPAESAAAPASLATALHEPRLAGLLVECGPDAPVSPPVTRGTPAAPVTAEGMTRRMRLTAVARTWALSMLHGSGGTPVVLDRLTEYVLEMAEASHISLGNPESPAGCAALDGLQRDYAVIRVALQHAMAAPRSAKQATTALRLAAALRRFWVARGYLWEGGEWLTRALGFTRRFDVRSAARGQALLGLAAIALRVGDIAEGRTRAALAAEACAAVGDTAGRDEAARLLVAAGAAPSLATSAPQTGGLAAGSASAPSATSATSTPPASVAAAGSGRTAGTRAPDGLGHHLTPRELEVAHLVATGLTNREIAERLVITERTAAAHVEHILGKLDLRSRVQVAAAFGAAASSA